MNRYELPKPRLVLAVAALALTAVTIGLSVVLPAVSAGAGEAIAATEPFEVAIAAARESLVYRER